MEVHSLAAKHAPVYRMALIALHEERTIALLLHVNAASYAAIATGCFERFGHCGSLILGYGTFTDRSLCLWLSGRRISFPGIGRL
jgi:hypothetical protein